jgi:hypothetical protein
MGNHECDGWTDSTCGYSGSQYPPPWITQNYLEFQSLFLDPIGASNPNYVRNISGPNNSWTAKFIFVAPNFWDPSVQPTWFKTALAANTTYTFVIHHENRTTTSPPSSLSSIESAESGKETVSIVGHQHQWSWSKPEVIIGNGGAPLNTGYDQYGFTLFSQQCDGSILVTPYESCPASGSCYSKPVAQTSSSFTLPK